MDTKQMPFRYVSDIDARDFAIRMFKDMGLSEEEIKERLNPIDAFWYDNSYSFFKP